MPSTKQNDDSKKINYHLATAAAHKGECSTDTVTRLFDEGVLDGIRIGRVRAISDHGIATLRARKHRVMRKDPV